MVTVTEPMPLDERERREWIKYRLGLRNYTLGRLSRELGVSRSAVNKALFEAYPRMEAELARVMGMAPQSIWPERYGADGKPNRSRGNPRLGVHSNRINTAKPARRNGNRRKGV